MSILLLQEQGARGNVARDKWGVFFSWGIGLLGLVDCNGGWGTWYVKNEVESGDCIVLSAIVWFE